MPDEEPTGGYLQLPEASDEPESSLKPSTPALKYSQLIKQDAEIALNELWWFDTHVMYFGRDIPDPDDPSQTVWFQMPEREGRPICDWLQTPRPSNLRPHDKRKRALIIPRNTTKTSKVQSYCGWKITKNPDIAILWLSDEKAKSKFVCDDLGNRLSSQRFEARYGRLKGDTHWTQQNFTVRTRKKPRKEPTFLSMGLENPVQFYHFDLIVCDDLQGDKNATPEGIEKVQRFLDLLWPVLNPGGELLWVCTRWDWLDTAGRILRDRDQGSSAWEVLPVSQGFLGATAMPGDEEFFRQKDGSTHVVPGAEDDTGMNFPSVLDKETVRKAFRPPPEGMGHYRASSQLENNPMPTEAEVFKEKDFRWVPDWIPGEERDLKVLGEEEGIPWMYYMAIDISSGADEVRYGAESAIHVIGTRGWGVRTQVVVCHSDGGLWKASDMISKLFLCYERWRPAQIGVPAHGMELLFLEQLKTKMQEEGMFLPLEEMTRNTPNAKEQAIRYMQPFYHAHQVFHFESLKNGPLEVQELRFKPGSSMRIDYADSLSMCFELIRPGLSRKAEKKKIKRQRHRFRYKDRAPRYKRTGW